MRRLVFPVILASGLVMLGAVPASAEPAPAATQAKAAAGKKVCKVTDPLLNELSGIVATDDGYVVINDGTDSSAREKVFFLNGQCDITQRIPFSGRGPADTEDMILAPGGKTLWIADTGDNGVRAKPATHRDTISVWTMPADGSKEPKIHRLAYPDGDYHDAEALLLDGKGEPLIITKELVGPAQIYAPAAALKSNNTEGVPLKKVGQVELPRTSTPGTAFARLAQGVVTGAAMSPDGKKVVLRTYLDAFEWDVTNGDVLAALKNKPRQTGLPNEPFGEAITYSPDGKTFATVSDFGDIEEEDATNYILRYTPATQVFTADAGAAGDAAKDKGPSWFSQLSLSDITYLVGAVGVLGALLVGAGIFGIVRSRKKPRPEPDDIDDEPTGPKPSDAATELLAVGGPPRTSGAASGPVYGAKPPQKGGVYGAGGARPPAAPPGRPGVTPPGAAPAGRPGAAPAGRPGAVQPGRPGAAQPGRPGGAQPGRPGGGQPARPAGGQPARPAGGQPARPAGGQPARPAGGQPARPAGGQPARPAGGQPARPAGGQPARPAGGQPARPAGGQPARPAGGQPARPAGGQPARPAGGQPARPAGGAPVRPGQGGQPRPAGGGGSGRPGGGVYGAPPPPPPGGGRQQSTGSPRPAGFFGTQGNAPSRPNGAMNTGTPYGRDGRYSQGR
ncbi:hypothetical protein COUCH_08815 [Couchioplanes caeruleus]|uniref:hypothetical protein n=1 Tax=Couchioplanes caeruleus TaxID=56438 RepID=UPI0020BE83D9|nr:hypothetical protein [Couchioplanes caeruleus]UQU66355.1 hypothetical protein COUCH_08815 [Couchioplanes caeruleus]